MLRQSFLQNYRKCARAGVDDFRYSNLQLLALDFHRGVYVHNRVRVVFQIRIVVCFVEIQSDDDEEPNYAPIQAYIQLVNKQI